MEQQSGHEEQESNIVEPERAVPRKYVPPILFLADSMSVSDRQAVPKELSVIDQLAEAAGVTGFRNRREYGTLTTARACEMLDLKVARRAALVVLSLVLKSDSIRKKSEHKYFHKVRELLSMEPVTVPVDLEAHLALAKQYVVKRSAPRAAPVDSDE